MRKNVPVRTPRSVHDELAEAAAAQGQSLASYLETLTASTAVVDLGLLSGACLGSTYVNPRPPEAELVRELAKRYNKRQWEILHELHRLYQKRVNGPPQPSREPVSPQAAPPPGTASRTSCSS